MRDDVAEYTKTRENAARRATYRNFAIVILFARRSRFQIERANAGRNRIAAKIDLSLTSDTRTAAFGFLLPAGVSSYHRDEVQRGEANRSVVINDARVG